MTTDVSLALPWVVVGSDVHRSRTVRREKSVFNQSSYEVGVRRSACRGGPRWVCDRTPVMKMPVKLTCAFLHLLSPLLPHHLMAHLFASQWRSLLSILMIIMATEPLNDSTPSSFDNLLSVAALTAMYNNPLPEPKLHPKKGRVCISSEYLDQISEAECIWHFQ